MKQRTKLADQIYQIVKSCEVSAQDLMLKLKEQASQREVGDAILELITAREVWVNERGLVAILVAQTG